MLSEVSHHDEEKERQQDESEHSINVDKSNTHINIHNHPNIAPLVSMKSLTKSDLKFDISKGNLS